MFSKLKASTGLFLSTALFLSLLAACSAPEAGPGSTPSPSQTPDSSATSLPETGEGEFPVVIKHAFGETIIESKPERIATIQWANHDVVLALGVVPVGFSAANYGVEDDSGLLPWTKAKLKELGEENPNVFQDTDGLDFEAIADSKPDVIMAAYSGITQEDYDILNRIAPVVPYQTTPWMTQWREQVTYTAMGMGMVEEGEQLIADTEALIAEKAAEYPQLKDKTVVWVNFNATDLSKLHMYTPTDPRGAFLYELGLTYPESVLSVIEDSTKYSQSLSAENADALYDADIIIGYGSDELYQAVKADPVLGKIPAVKKGAVVLIPGNTPLGAAGNPNPLSIEYTIDEYLALIAEALDKSNG
ncbi:Iron ABC transporter permease [uncultured Eubacteriales bacterium]|uniref:Iron ABC transporter permease n=1 Tax=uncultured Eubacteriales bacterium TaxID=172733 RepID=A0A212JFE8_9FIRM|nr:Iron ABC transporter permease [uncultured Eubacteriales bacterium]